MFIDEKIVCLKAGNGGDGCLSFRREKYIPKGGPNGGDGGKGGNIIVQCDHNLADLTPYHFKPNWSAQNAQTGMGNHKHGADGQDCILKLPPGTIIYDLETERKVLELIKHGQQVILIEGGKGGLGNVHFKSATNQAPRKITEGIKVEKKEYRFVLKVIADIGLVGYPNAGKSSLMNTITMARPKVAPYPFTTKNPNIGIIEYPEEEKRLQLADIPGLIDGASENRGLGHRFLKHIERCRVLLFMIDMAGIDMRNPADDYSNLVKELSLYDESLLEKQFIVVANKMDLPESQENLKEFKKRHKVDICTISCITQEGIDDLKTMLLKYQSKEV